MKSSQLPKFAGAATALLFLLDGVNSRLSADTLTGVTGGGSPVENRQPTLSTRYIIALTGIYPGSGSSDLGEQQPPDRSTPFMAEIRAVAFDFAPKGWAFCEGQTLPINQNQALFSLLGVNFGGNGTTNFKLPDLRGRVPMGAGTGFGLPTYAIGQPVGTAASALSVANLPPHTHTVPGGRDTSAAGSGAAVDNRQPSLALQYYIAADGEIMLTAFTRAINGWAYCDGSVFPVAGHSYAFFYIGSTYGGDGGFSSFAVPDLRGRTVLGDDNTSAFPIGKVMGSKDLLLNVADMPAHAHSLSFGSTGFTGNVGNTASNYQPSLVLREMLCLVGNFPSSDSGAATPFFGEMRWIAGTSSSGLGNSFAAMYGQILGINQNQALFSLLGTTYGGNGQTTFAIPDLRGRLDLEPDGTVELQRGSVVGSATFNISLAQLAPHAHSFVYVIFTGIQRLTNGTATLSMEGTTGSTAQVEESDNLSNWSYLGQVNFSSPTQNISDSSAGQTSKRFYHAYIP
jgi:microcystin-dependent protein